MFTTASWETVQQTANIKHNAIFEILSWKFHEGPMLPECRHIPTELPRIGSFLRVEGNCVVHQNEIESASTDIVSVWKPTLLLRRSRVPTTNLH